MNMVALILQLLQKKSMESCSTDECLNRFNYSVLLEYSSMSLFVYWISFLLYIRQVRDFGKLSMSYMTNLVVFDNFSDYF